MNRNRNPDLAENSAGARVTSENTTGNGIAPQITSTIGVPEPPPEVVEATGAAGAVTVLNPNAPVNRLSEGGIVFAYPDLVYSQFIDIDQQIEVTDDTSPGSVVLQIPYHPISQYTNQFIQSYARMHGRYNGDLIFRAQIIGNTTFSGTLMWYWWPRRYPSAIASMADAMKYSYKSQSIQFNSVEELLLHDARQYLYYRDMDELDIDSRPHLVLIVHTTIMSPLREGIKVRIRIGSRLASASMADRAKMATPFIFANPLPIPASGTPGADFINGRSLPEIFPHLSTTTYRMMIDGNTTGTYNLFDNLGHARKYSLETQINGLLAPVDTISYQKNFITMHTTSEDGKYYFVYSAHQFDPTLVSNIARDGTFFSMTNANVLSVTADAAFIKSHTSVYATRSLSTSLNIMDGVTLVQQTTCYTSAGKITLFVVEIKNGTPYPGFTNIAGGTQMLLPHSNVLGPTNYTDNLVKLPGNWVSLKFTDEEPSVVASNTDIAPTSFNDPAVLSYFIKLSDRTTEDQILQFDLVDSVARIRVATVRFVPGRKEFVINPSDAVKYRQYAGDLSNLLFANFGVQPAAAAFPLTDTTNWLSRFPSSSLTTIRNFIAAPEAIPNAAVVPEVLGSLVEGLEGATEVLSGSKSLLSSNIALEPPILSQDIQTPVNLPSVPVYNPSMNVNIPLMQQTGVPTWTTKSSQPIDMPSRFEGTELGPTPVDPETGEYEPSDTEGEDPSGFNPTQRDAFNGFSSGFKALRAMTLGEITHLITAPFALQNGNVAGSIVGSGINWAHDKDVMGQAQEGQAQMQQSQQTFQNQQNQNTYENQQKMQSIDIANRQQMQQNQFGQETRMQQNSFNQQRYMQGQTFQHDFDIQGRGFQQQTNINNLDFAHATALGAQSIMGTLANTATGGLFGVAGDLVTAGMNLWGQSRNQDFQREMNQTTYNQNLNLQHNSILGNIANTATGGVFGLASSAIGAGVGLLEQNSDQNFQSQMLSKTQDFQKQIQTQNFNNAIYASGNSASALKIASPA